jgi:hypothetical protein
MVDESFGAIIKTRCEENDKQFIWKDGKGEYEDLRKKRSGVEVEKKRGKGKQVPEDENVSEKRDAREIYQQKQNFPL